MLPAGLLVGDWLKDHNTDYADYKEREYNVRMDKITRELNIIDLMNQPREVLS